MQFDQQEVIINVKISAEAWKNINASKISCLEKARSISNLNLCYFQEPFYP